MRGSEGQKSPAWSKGSSPVGVWVPKPQKLTTFSQNGCFGATYAVHLRLIRQKAHGGLPISGNRTFFARCYG